MRLRTIDGRGSSRYSVLIGDREIAEVHRLARTRGQKTRWRGSLLPSGVVFIEKTRRSAVFKLIDADSRRSEAVLEPDSGRSGGNHG